MSGRNVVSMVEYTLPGTAISGGVNKNSLKVSKTISHHKTISHYKQLRPLVEISYVKRRLARTEKRFDVKVLTRRVHVLVSTKRTVPATRGADATYSK